MSATWLGKEEVCRLTGWTDRWLRKLSRIGGGTGGVTVRESGKGPTGYPVRQYLLSSLPEAAQQKYLDARAVPGTAKDLLPENAARTYPASLQLSFAVAAGHSSDVQSPQRVALPPSAEKEANRRMEVLEPLVEYLAQPESRARFHRLALTDGSLVTNSDSLARYLAEQHKVSASTIWAWKRRYDTGGSIALARKLRTDKNRSAWASENRELADLAALVYMGNHEQPGQSKRIAWEAVCERAQRMAVAAPSYETVRSFLANPTEVSPSMLTYGREGRKRYDAQFAPYMRRGYTEAAYSILVSDHMIHDVLCQNDVFGERDGKHIRLQMTTILDYRSRFVVGAAWCENGSSQSIYRALHKTFRTYGLPDLFYCDNGKDFRKVARRVLPLLNVPVKFCLPFSPQSKHIERYHGIVHGRFDHAFPTYSGSAPHLRPDMATAALARHGKLLHMGRQSESQLPLASEFIAMCEDWIESWYHEQSQPGEGMDGRTPRQVFEAERVTTRTSPDAGQLAMLLCDHARLKVANCGVSITLAGKRFRFVPAISDAAAYVQMHELSGRNVTIAYDPLQPLYAAVLDDEMRFVCKLEQEKLMRMSSDDETRSDVGAFLANRNGLRKAVRESTAALNRRVRADGYTTLEDSMRERLTLPRAVGDSGSIVQSPERPAEDFGYKHTHADDNVARYFERLGGQSVNQG